MPSRSIRIAAVVLSVGLAWLTYKLVERPIRLGNEKRFKVEALIVLMAIVGVVGYNSYQREGLKFRDAEASVKINRFDYPYTESCKQITGEIFNDDWCNNGVKTGGSIATVMIGDSFSNAYSTMLKAYSERVDTTFTFVQFGRGQCPSLLDYGPPYCKLITSKSFEYIKSHPEVKTVIMSSHWPDYYNGKDFNWVKHIESKDAFIIAFQKTIKAYKDLGKNIVVLFSPPVGSNPKSCIIRPVRITDKNICNLPASNALSNDGNYREYLIPLLSSMGIKYFDPFKYFCNEVECKITENGKIFSIDGRHMSVFGGEFLSIKASAELRKLFSN